MGHGSFQKFVLTMASGGTLTAAFDLGRAQARIGIGVDSVSATTMYLQVAGAIDGTYRRVFQDGTGATAPGLYQVTMASSAAVHPAPGGYRYIKIETEAEVVDGASFEILAGDSK